MAKAINGEDVEARPRNDFEKAVFGWLGERGYAKVYLWGETIAKSDPNGDNTGKIF